MILRVAVLDTGLADHPDFRRRRCGLRSFVKGEEDETGHGTHCAGVIWQVAPFVEIYAGKVLNAFRESEGDSVLAGLRWARECGCQVVCLAMELIEGQRDGVAAAIREYPGVVVAAAGNGSWRPEVVNPAGFPACLPEVIAAGALDEDGEIARFSNDADRYAPGVGIVSTLPCQLGSRGARTGTSVAAAHISGQAANAMWHGTLHDFAKTAWKPY